MIEKDFWFPSADRRTKIHAVKWMPDTKEYDFILQIAHGMQEYIGRYREFAEFLTDRRVLVVGHDHLGHGESVASSLDYGFFAEKNAGRVLIQDMHRLRTSVQGKNKQVPYFMLGHSMGSYLLRRYLTLHSECLCGAVIVGTGSMPDLVMKFGMGICRFLGMVKGWRYRSPLLKKMSFLGPYQKYDVTGRDVKRNWLTKDLAIAEKYYKDPGCCFDFTVNGYYGLMETVHYDNQPENIAKIKKTLPLFLVSGDKDPVGNMGKGVRYAFRQYKTAGLSDVSMKLYENDRHELLNETDRIKVYGDIYHWMQKRLKCEI